MHRSRAIRASGVNVQQRDAEQRYCLEVEGQLPTEWAEWFGAESCRTTGDTTVFELRVRDQAALHGVLRRVHDLHLRLISLTRLDPNTKPQL